MSLFFGQEILVSAEVQPDRIILVHRQPSMQARGDGQPVPDRVFRRTYGVDPQGRGLVMLREELGRVVPPVPEHFEFPPATP